MPGRVDNLSVTQFSCITLHCGPGRLGGFFNVPHFRLATTHDIGKLYFSLCVCHGFAYPEAVGMGETVGDVQLSQAQAL